MCVHSPVEPCSSMNRLVERMARGEKLGFWGWYAKLHVPRCPKCNAALAALQRAIQAISVLRTEETATPSESFWRSLDEKLAEADSPETRENEEK
ncbi:MAG: hypothetical protein LCH41_09665 [Armatimonadetes bacterium]|nr:hypothetical protein [Armatimonadota bacterium]